MSCCPPAPALVDAASGDLEIGQVQDTQILPGESVECYMKRAENPSGLKDDLTGIVPNRILNTSVPVKPDASVDVTFKLTPGSDVPAPPPGDATPWVWTFQGLPSWLTASGSTLSGTAPASEHGKRVSILVTATRAVAGLRPERTDSRTFVFSPAPSSSSNSIQFVHPLPGGRVTSIFNPNRVHPVRGTVAPHKGVDMSTPGAATSDVVAAADGEVVFTGFQAGGAGNYLKINHYDGSNQLLCQTVYMHLDRFYVTKGQKVAAGQKIGREGSTGIGTAAHLHFECRLIKGGATTWIDPLPLIRGTLQVAETTNPDNSGSGFQPQTSDARLTAADAQARGGGCAPFGPDYGRKPGDPPAPPPTPPSGGPTEPADVFDRAWYFTMTYEVGPHWETAPEFSPSDPDLAAGLFETTLQRKKVGYKNYPGFPGGETKFGIAQGPNSNIKVAAIDYASAKATGYRGYWKKGPDALEATKPRTAIMLFDMYYLHGPGNAKHIQTTANIAPLSDTASCEALQQAQEAFIRDIVAANPSRQRYLNGWLNRSRALKQYALTVVL